MKTWTPLLILAATAIAATSAFADPVADAKAHSEAFAKAMNERNVKAALAMYADNAHLIWPGQGEEAKGKAEIEKLITTTFKSMPKDAKVTFKGQDAVSLGNGYVATIGHWEQSGAGPDGKIQTVAIRTSELIKIEGKKTLYVVDHASIGTAPPPAATSAK